MTHTRHDFLRKIAADLEADAPRLVYADWLSENGEEPRAELIRCGVELATIKLPDVIKVRGRIQGVPSEVGLWEVWIDQESRCPAVGERVDLCFSVPGSGHKFQAAIMKRLIGWNPDRAEFQMIPCHESRVRYEFLRRRCWDLVTEELKYPRCPINYFRAVGGVFLFKSGYDAEVHNSPSRTSTWFDRGMIREINMRWNSWIQAARDYRKYEWVPVVQCPSTFPVATKPLRRSMFWYKDEPETKVRWKRVENM